MKIWVCHINKKKTNRKDVENRQRTTQILEKFKKHEKCVECFRQNICKSCIYRSLEVSRLGKTILKWRSIMNPLHKIVHALKYFNQLLMMHDETLLIRLIKPRYITLLLQKFFLSFIKYPEVQSQIKKESTISNISAWLMWCLSGVSQYAKMANI